MIFTRLALAALAVGFAGFAAIDPASAQAPSSCYASYPGARGKACCDKSYARASRGSASREARRQELSACAGSNPGDKANEFRRRGGRRGD